MTNYHKATKVFSNSKKRSKEYQLALCIYLSFKTEQIAFANGFDSAIKNMKRLNLDMARDFNKYKFLYTFHHVIEHFNDYKDICLNLFNKTPEYILKLIKKSYSEYSRRIGRIFTKNQIREMKHYIL